MLLRIVRLEHTRSFLCGGAAPLPSSLFEFEISNGMASFLYAAINRTM